MLFYFFITIVFIAELIITFVLILQLFKLDKMFIEYNVLIDEAKPVIKEIMQLSRKISEQFIEFAPTIVDKIKSVITDIIMGQIKSALGAVTFWLVKKEVEKHV